MYIVFELNDMDWNNSMQIDSRYSYVWTLIGFVSDRGY